MTDTRSQFKRAWFSEAQAIPGLKESLESAGLEVLDLPASSPWEAVAEGDLVLLSMFRPLHNPFLLTSRLKQPGFPQLTVVLICSEEEREQIAPLAQFCMVDGLLFLDPSREVSSSETMELLLDALERPVAPPSTDEMLERLESKLGEDARALADRVITGLSLDKERSFIDSVTDPETGLFEGGFMAFKLEEEFKRSWRFRYPLTVVLLDLPGSEALGQETLRVLGEAAGVFLNECRDIDFVGRYDATSFLLLLPNTGRMGARVLATRILKKLSNDIASPVPLDPAVAIATVPRSGIERKDDLLDLARLTLVRAWAGKGEERVQVAD